MTMKPFVIAACLVLAGTSTSWSAGCSASAVDKTGKSLAGAAKTSFMAKCEREAKATCERSAADKKLNGAAKTSFITKCVKDAG